MADKDDLRQLQIKAREMLEKRELSQYDKIHKQILALLKRNPQWKTHSL